MADLAALVLTVTPTEPLLAPAHLGRAVYAQLLRLIAAEDEALATHLHDSDAWHGRRPYTCSTLIGGVRHSRESRRYTPDRPTWLRLTGLIPAVADLLVHWASHPPPEIELDGHTFAVTSATIDSTEHPWAGATTYETLATPYLLGRTPPDYRLTLQFASPTTFRQKGISQPVPLGNWVFGSLVDRWNAFSPVQLAPETRRYAHECVALSQYRLRTRAVPLKANVVQMGCLGRATFALLNRDRFWGSMLNLLAEYAFYSGVGYQTTVGLGQTRRFWPDRAPRREENRVS